MDKQIPQVLTESLEDKFVRPLESGDAAAVAELEAEAYKDNPALLHPDFGAAKRLAEMISARKEGNANLSFKIERRAEIDGYLIAFEKRYYADDGPIPKEAPYILIADFAVRNLGTFLGARTATALLKALMFAYKHEYVDKGRQLPIILDTREHTSRKITSNAVAKILPRLGINFLLEEYPDRRPVRI